MKRVIISLITLAFFFQAYSQEFIPSDAHSPNAAELSSYGFMPVSYYTGRANVSIPIFSTTQRGVPMSITLDYNTSGIPANGLPGWTGIGWTLNTGGVITRSVKGIQDEYKCHQCPTPVGFQNYFESHGQLLVDKGNTANNYELLRNNVEQYKYDYAPDVFYFNFMGRHGSFFLGQDGEWKIRCDENLDVLLDPDDESSLIYPIFETCPGRPEKQPKCIKGFTLVDENSKDKYSLHYNNLPQRPDYDGYITFNEANDWYSNGNGQPLYADIRKLDLSNFYSLGDKYIGKEYVFNLLNTNGFTDDGLVYGNVTFKRTPNDCVTIYKDTYDFDMKSWSNPDCWLRNIETIIGGMVAGEGTPFDIYFYNQAKLNILTR